MKNFPIRNTNVDVWHCSLCNTRGIGKTLPDSHECDLTIVNRDFGYYLKSSEGKFFTFIAERLVNGYTGRPNNPLA